MNSLTAQALSSVLGKDWIRVHQLWEKAEMVAFWEGPNSYEIQLHKDSAAGEEGKSHFETAMHAKEVGNRVAIALKGSLENKRPFQIAISADKSAKNPALVLKRKLTPWFFFSGFSSTSIKGAAGEHIGVIEEKWGLLYRKYVAYGPDGKKLAIIRAARWAPASFTILPVPKRRGKGNQEIGHIYKVAGLGTLKGAWKRMFKDPFGVAEETVKQVLTDADDFDLKMCPDATELERAIGLAAVFAIDMDFFEDQPARGAAG